MYRIHSLWSRRPKTWCYSHQFQEQMESYFEVAHNFHILAVSSHASNHLVEKFFEWSSFNVRFVDVFFFFVRSNDGVGSCGGGNDAIQFSRVNNKTSFRFIIIIVVVVFHLPHTHTHIRCHSINDVHWEIALAIEYHHHSRATLARIYPLAKTLSDPTYIEYFNSNNSRTWRYTACHFIQHALAIWMPIKKFYSLKSV